MHASIQRAAVAAWEPVAALFALLLQPASPSRRLALDNVSAAARLGSVGSMGGTATCSLPCCVARRRLRVAQAVHHIAACVPLGVLARLSPQVLLLMQAPPAGEDDRLAKAALFSKYTGGDRHEAVQAPSELSRAA